MVSPGEREDVVGLNSEREEKKASLRSRTDKWEVPEGMV